MTASVLTKNQKKKYGPRTYQEDGRTYRITATVRYDDEFGNGHNSFSITAHIDCKIGNRGHEYRDGCCHTEIAKQFPELAPLIKWHLCSSDGPMHYIANTLYHAGDRDAYGLRKGEVRQIKSGKTGLPVWKIKELPYEARMVYAEEKPAPITLEYEPCGRVGEGKARDLEAARRSAIWPEASDADLMVEPEELKRKLEERLPALLEEFRTAVESLGFTY